MASETTAAQLPEQAEGGFAVHGLLVGVAEGRPYVVRGEERADVTVTILVGKRSVDVKYTNPALAYQRVNGVGRLGPIELPVWPRVVAPKADGRQFDPFIAYDGK